MTVLGDEADALLARLAEAENRRMIARSDADDFKSRLAEAEKERDNARRRSEQLAEIIAKRTALMQAAEAERDRLKAALKRIAGPNVTGAVPARLSFAQRIAYTALAADEESGET